MSRGRLEILEKEVGDLQAALREAQALLYEAEKDREDLVERVISMQDAHEDRDILLRVLGVTYEEFIQQRSHLVESLERAKA